LLKKLCFFTTSSKGNLLDFVKQKEMKNLLEEWDKLIFATVCISCAQKKAALKQILGNILTLKYWIKHQQIAEEGAKM